MSRRRGEEGEPRKQEPRSVEDFERLLGEEVSVSTDFGLPLCVFVARSRGEFPSEIARQAVGLLRQGDLISRTAPEEISIALPNTMPENAEIVERRLREALPEIAIGLAFQEAGDTAHGLLFRARTAADRENASG